jgi:hypothetical protein
MVRLPRCGLGVVRRVLPLLVALSLALAAAPDRAAGRELAAGRGAPVDRALQQRIARRPSGTVPVLIQRSTDRAAVAAVRSKGGSVRRHLKTGRVLAASVPAGAVAALAREPGVVRVSYDAPVRLNAGVDWAIGRWPAPTSRSSARRRCGRRRGRSSAPG